MSRIGANEFFADFSSLARLKTQSQKDPDAALKQVAKEFESIFINMMFKNMRSANENIGSDLFSSSQMKHYQEMMDSQMSQSLANNGGVGLADALIRQLSNRSGVEATQASSSMTRSDSDWLSQLNRIDSGQLNTMVKLAADNAAKSDSEKTAPQSSISQNSLSQSSSSQNSLPPNTVSAKEVIFDSPEAFVEALWPLAKQAGESIGVDPKAILAQAALESGWGKYPIAKEDGNASFNLFGIKADSRWSGDKAVVNTLEYRDGIAKKERAAFRAYSSFQDSFIDYADFLDTSERYKDALQAGDDAAMFAAYLQKGGYATDPDYATKIQNILSSKWFTRL
ncbi:flagellar assembly peptidoglycan hydrolase FlgJ [Marinomonas mediterranea]|jgi:flagellar rod assembly protein/muramidase FlgJ|uniref:Peptidoglycan hydrolase FlgJ n=1 Tax=Marinomonas mediterranea (strain ATCC 700492 / JCM 21426 / NBRC 103028 / MMB-1) TaxID=717774 RepID=F2K4T3_MARM1|nr:flagellar assembly peptidoglycan hydrolase FlgJ [Marinomonas mediterranea]ADZ92576.1 flagellar rod assembly protein/muramidase FlgJ [Marinomonas mediterranea MMB-1]WCN10520.1 flagellar assembly peptidoglycan hydrolase FlgJ [Marinomonas mediterranea]WCN14570.1 flagellar assembly peptidoglycan hydrolase FlgJ [Marinomonas mediterranea]WCN18619.1 flagellar assembly peptidoglycan hydrolase FlgJ [Marinomonas mediterranea MMB-1]